MKIRAFAYAGPIALALFMTSFAPSGSKYVCAAGLVGSSTAHGARSAEFSLDQAPPTETEDHETAQEAHREGKLVPYGRIRSAVQEQFNGRVVYQSLSPGKDGGWVYELKVLKDDGHVLMVFVDASSGEVLKTKGKN